MRFQRIRIYKDIELLIVYPLEKIPTLEMDFKALFMVHVVVLSKITRMQSARSAFIHENEIRMHSANGRQKSIVI